ncbi:hypothetical protein CPB84DRAFT_1689988 [Gymnopilus junonius]|uniref:Uncharacterized protein n=1 Tax=Gymnopilus junonius TaxID=109634 RepID=A0A9P5TH85_GYMJU|nr:hypothetical protein CPB84DRAFT_1689988 [Gymnopilus junonius]
MFGSNPYAQAGWYNPQNPLSINSGPWQPNSSNPPTFGALPSQSGSKSILAFEFSSFNPDIFNCLVTGPKQHKFFEVKTTSNNTLVSKPEGPFAIIHWAQRPTVEASGVIAFQRTGGFLKLTSDRSHRTMTVNGKSYAWVPGSNGINLYTNGPNPPQQYARLSINGNHSKITLEITSEAFQAGLFEPCIVSTILLFCARNID